MNTFVNEFVAGCGLLGDALYVVEDVEMPLFNNNKLQNISLVDLEKGVTIPSIQLAFKLDKEMGVLRKVESEGEKTQQKS